MKSKNKSKKRKLSLHVRFRFFMFLLLFVCSVSVLGYNCGNNLIKLMELKAQKEDLKKQIVYLMDEKENLEADVERLSDSTYIARYARERYLYSKDDEIIIRIDNEDSN